MQLSSNVSVRNTFDQNPKAKQQHYELRSRAQFIAAIIPFNKSSQPYNMLGRPNDMHPCIYNLPKHSVRKKNHFFFKYDCSNLLYFIRALRHFLKSKVWFCRSIASMKL